MHTQKDPSTPFHFAQDNTLSSFSLFEKNPTLAVAVSGGADSMALLLLANDWVKKHDGKVVALTVDHGLRKESAAEAKQVKKWCYARHIEHHTLTLTRNFFTKKSQETARNARYALLTDWCKKNTVLHLLTAHHKDDQAETFFFRLARGSGIDGLASIAKESTRDGVRMLRPLLATTKQELQDFLRANNQSWIEDPSNATAAYTRNIIRTQLTPALRNNAVLLASRIGIIRHSLDLHLAEVMARTISIYPDGYATLSMSEFAAAPPGYGVRMLAALVQTLGGEKTPPRTEKLHRLYDDLQHHKTRTLGGCVFRYQPGKQRFMVKREGKTATKPGFWAPKPLAGQPFLGLNKVDEL